MGFNLAKALFWKRGVWVLKTLTGTVLRKKYISAAVHRYSKSLILVNIWELPVELWYADIKYQTAHLVLSPNNHCCPPVLPCVRPSYFKFHCSVSFPSAKWAELLPVDYKARPTILLFWHHSCPIYPGLGLYPWEFQESLPAKPYCLFWAGLDRSLHHLCPNQLPAPAPGWEPSGCSPQRPLPPSQAPFGICEAHDAFLDDSRPKRQGPICWLSLQCYRRQLGEEKTRVGHANGEFSDGGGHQVTWSARLGSLLGPGSWASPEADWCSRKGRGAMSPIERSEFLSGKKTWGKMFEIYAICIPNFQLSVHRHLLQGGSVYRKEHKVFGASSSVWVFGHWIELPLLIL